MNSNNNKIVGRLGESKACDFLIKNMYTILERNYSTKIGEVDIIAKQAGVIVFVEVKRRMTRALGYGRFAVTKNKQFKIKKVALQYLKSKKLFDVSVRFDVIELDDDNIQHLINAFY